MASTLQTNFNFTLNPIIVSVLGNLSIVAQDRIQWPSGTGAGQADLCYAAQRTVASSGSPDSIDLSGSLAMIDGSAAVFARIRMLYIQHLGTPVTDDANILSVGAGSNAWATWVGGTSPVLKIRNNPGKFFLEAGDATAYTVTAGTGDILQVATAAGTNVPYLIIAVGASA